MPMKNVHVLLVHGADRLAFAEDIEQAEKRGTIAHSLELPLNRGDPIDDCHDYYDAVSDMIAAEIDSIRQESETAVIAAIGRNLGGSLLAYHAARHGTPDILVFTGAIPDLARFRAKSNHEGARNFRAKLPDEDRQSRIMSMADLDLVATLPAIPQDRCLFQVGNADPWLDNGSWEAVDNLEKNGFVIERLADDHAMVSDDSLNRRWRFIARMSEG